MLSGTLGSVLKTLLQMVVVLFAVSVAAFFLMAAIPGDTIDLLVPPGATPEEIDQISSAYGLDQSVFHQYVDWISKALTGDFGRSIVTRQSVSELVGQRYPVSMELALMALSLALLVALPLGVYCGYRPGGRVDRVVGFVSSGTLAVPTFLLAPILLYIFSIKLGLLPLTGYKPWSAGATEHLKYMVLPVITLAAGEAVLLLRVLRSDMMATLREDFVVSARARGLETRRILFGHALRPSSFSLITVFGVTLGRLIGGSVIVESIFRIPGLGQLVISSISSRDFITTQAVILIVGVTYVVINALVDASYSLLDPRVRSTT